MEKTKYKIVEGKEISLRALLAYTMKDGTPPCKGSFEHFFEALKSLGWEYDTVVSDYYLDKFLNNPWVAGFKHDLLEEGIIVEVKEPEIKAGDFYLGRVSVFYVVEIEGNLRLIDLADNQLSGVTFYNDIANNIIFLGLSKIDRAEAVEHLKKAWGVKTENRCWNCVYGTTYPDECKGCTSLGNQTNPSNWRPKR